MIKGSQKNQRFFLIALIVICMGIILSGGLYYISSLRANLMEQSIQNVLTVTKQQQQAFDNFIAGDQERLHSFADFFAYDETDSPEDIQRLLKLFNEVEAIYTVIDLDNGWFCSSASDKIRQLDQESLEGYNSLQGSGVRNSFIGQFSGNPRFGYYETFTFADGNRGLVQKSYDRSKVSGTFSLSFYNDQGLSHVVNQDGDILLRPASITENFYDSIFDVMAANDGQQEKVELFKKALHGRETGSMTFARSGGELVYTYVPMENVDGWFLISVVSVNAITAETDDILMNSRLTLGVLAVVLMLFAMFILLIWRNYKAIEEKDQEIDYQEKFFNAFVEYLANNTDDVYLMVDAAMDEIEYISPNIKRVLGVSPTAIVPGLKLFQGAIVCDSGEPVDLKALRRLEPGMSIGPLASEWVTPETEEHKWFQIKVYCTQVQEQKKIIIDISDRTKDRKVQDTLSEALKMAQAANHAKSSFLSNVSHDIRTPMNAIIGFVALLQDEAENPNVVREYVQRIDSASQHLLSLINDVLDMNKIESGSTTLNLSEMNLAELIDEINAIIRPQVKEKDQTFEIFTSPITHEHLEADKLRINQILINLLSNAVKYTPEGGDIQMRVDELPQVLDDYSRIRFTISDNGMGMSEEYLKVIFDPFTREETEATRQIQGTGLGMAITKSLVDLLGGTIQVRSRLGEGSTFIVELELHVQEQENDPHFWSKHRVKKMIVTDDDEEICLNIVKIMAKTGVVTDYATNGETAIQMIQAAQEAGEPYDLSLLDWKMPGLNGLETARLLRKRYSEKIPILIFTAYDWGDIEQEAAEIGVNHFMPKPFFMSTFKDAIRKVMGEVKKSETSAGSMVVDGKHILVVDDIEVNRIILMKILSALGATCEMACNGQEAEEKFRDSPPGGYDLILMDVQMPVVNGYEATRAIRSSGHPSALTVPIIAMTANAFVDDVRDAIESGMDAHIAKPVQLDTLKNTIQMVFDSRKQQNTTM